MNEEAQDDFASIDLAVAFFACVIMIFAVIEFAFDARPLRPERPSTGQQQKSLEAIPSGWSSVVRRSAHGLLLDNRLDLISSEAAAGAIDGSAPVLPEDAPSVTVAVAGNGLPPSPPPNSFVIRLSVDPGVLPTGWRRETVHLGPDAGCPLEGEGALLTVWINDASGDLDPLLTWAERCGVSLRYERLRQTDSGRLTPAIGLSPAAYSHQTIFR